MANARMMYGSLGTLPTDFLRFLRLYTGLSAFGSLSRFCPMSAKEMPQIISFNDSFIAAELSSEDFIFLFQSGGAESLANRLVFGQFSSQLRNLGFQFSNDDRMFTITKSYLHREMDRGAKEAGVKRIRIHDIRHSAVSLLIDMGFSATAIADRVGHESIDITLNYAHLFPSKQAEMADRLNMIHLIYGRRCRLLI